jgi:hypothetical protein
MDEIALTNIMVPCHQLTLAIRAGNEPSRARLGSARCSSVADRARLGSARPFHELGREARLGSKVAREPHPDIYNCII